MQTLVNHQLIKRKARFGKIATGIGLGAMGIAFFASFRLAGPVQETDWTMVATSYGVLIVALVALSVARYHLARWSRHPRADEVLVDNLTGFDNKYYLLSYVPGLPVDHLIVTPRGLIVIVAKHLLGEIRNRGARWSRRFSWGQFFGGYSEGGLGNPTHEAMRSVAAIKAHIAQLVGEAEAEAIPVSAAIVFTDGRAQVQVQDPTVPVVTPDDLRTFVRAEHASVKIAPERVDRLASVLAPDRSIFKKEEKPAAKAKKRKKPRMTAPPPTEQSKMGRNRAERRMK